MAGHHVLAAVGVDRKGDKRLLGLSAGSSENAQVVVKDHLLTSFVQRGLAVDVGYLFVIDDGKALRSAGGGCGGMDVFRMGDAGKDRVARSRRTRRQHDSGPITPAVEHVRWHGSCARAKARISLQAGPSGVLADLARASYADRATIMRRRAGPR